MIGYEHTGVRNIIQARVSFWGISFTQYYILFHPCRQVPLKKGNSQMDSSVQDNPAAPSPVSAEVLVRKFRQANPAQLS
jgi:hypothetical protein